MTSTERKQNESDRKENKRKREKKAKNNSRDFGCLGQGFEEGFMGES